MPQGAQNGVLTTTTQGQESSEFGDITFTKTGTYCYKISERLENADGYVYDETIYRIRYVVTEGSGDTLNVKRTMYKVVNDKVGKVQSGDDTIFVNEYKAPNKVTPTKVTLTSGGTKTPVKTGDTSPIFVYTGILISAVALLVILLVWRRRREDK